VTPAERTAGASNRIGIILNAKAGSASEGLTHRLQEAFRSHGVEPRILIPDTAEAFGTTIREAIEDGFDTLVAGGGDGTVNAVAAAIIGTETRLGVLPLGTLNHFARDLGIPLDLDAAVATVVSGTVTAVDAGEVNGKIFVNNSSLGLYPAVVRLRDNLQSTAGYGKWRAFLRASMGILLRFPRLRLEMTPVGRSTIRCKTPLLFVGNNSYETGLLTLGTRKRLDGGELWIVLPAAATRWRMFMLLVAMVRGTEERAEELTTLTSPDLLIRSRKRRLRVATDGEVITLKPPLRYRIHRKALLVMTPQAAETAASGDAER
jgi:diacylglycerol kinase family enzyme